MSWLNTLPLNALFGGMLIGLAASLLWLFNGKIAGVSGIISGIFQPKSPNFIWQILFIAGILIAPYFYALFFSLPNIKLSNSILLYVIAGLIVGFGTRLGSGCTSGHGICGNARLSVRSLVATLTFMFFGLITVYIGRHLLMIF